MTMTPGITRAGTGEDGTTWHIMGQTYRPMQHSADSFAFHTFFPAGTFVPPHIHPTQDEFIYVLHGEFEVTLDGQPHRAGAGDLVKLPRGIPHGISNRSGGDVTALFWVTPSGKLHELFTRIHDLVEPSEVVRISAECDVEFLPPPG